MLAATEEAVAVLGSEQETPFDRNAKAINQGILTEALWLPESYSEPKEGND